MQTGPTALFRARAHTFSFAALFLPADRRACVAGLYAFARAVDDLVDEPPPTCSPVDQLRLLAAWRNWLDQPALLTAPDAGVAQCVMPALQEHTVPAAYLQMLIDGVASDLTREEMRTWSELRAYCVQVASSVGLAMCHLLGAGGDPLAREAAVELGVAMQLTNILRDVGADLAAGRVYLATEDLAVHGYSRERLDWLAERTVRRGPSAVDAGFRSLMRSQIERAREHYARGLTGVPRLPRECRLAILLAARLYCAILDDIEAAAYDVFTRRAATSRWRKLVEATRASLVVQVGGVPAYPRLPVRQ